MEFRKFQEQQNRDEVAAEVNAFEEPMQKLVDDGKLLDRQKKDLLDEHDRNLQNLQRTHDIGKVDWNLKNALSLETIVKIAVALIKMIVYWITSLTE